MKRMEQIIVVGILFLFLVVNMQASDSRKIVLTGTIYHEFTPTGMVITSVDALLNPVYMLDYPALVNLDYDSPTGTYSGFGFAKLEPFGLPGVFGFQIGKRYGSYRDNIWSGPGQDINNLNGLVSPICGQTNVGVDGVNVTNLNGMRSFGLYYALPLGDNLRVGLGFNQVGRDVSGNRINDPQSVSTEMDDTFTKKISTSAFRVGVGYTWKEKVNLNLDFGIGNPKYKYEYVIATGSTADGEEADFAASDTDLNLKVDYLLSENTALVANMSYLSFGGSLDIDPDTATADDGTTYKRLQKSFLLLLGPLFHGEGYNYGIQLGFMSDTSKDEMSLEATGTDTQKNNPRTSYNPILRAFGEKQLFNWFAMRASITYTAYKEKTLYNLDTDPATEDWESVSAQPASSLVIALGFTVNMKKGFYIEGYMYDDIFREGPYILTGNASFPDFNAGFSLGIRL